MNLADFAAEILNELASFECIFWACDGPDVPFEDMKTCRVCALIQRCREVRDA